MDNLSPTLSAETRAQIALARVRSAIQRAAAMGCHIVVTHQHDAGEYLLPGQIDVVEDRERLTA